MKEKYSCGPLVAGNTSAICSNSSQISPTGFSYKICKSYFRCKNTVP